MVFRAGSFSRLRFPNRQNVLRIGCKSENFVIELQSKQQIRSLMEGRSTKFPQAALLSQSTKVFQSSICQILEKQHSSVSPSRLFASEAKAKIVKVPGMGDSISEGTIKVWHKKAGDYVKVDDIIVTIETDKIASDIRAQEAGKIVQTFAKETENISVGANLYSIDTTAAPPVEAKAPEKPAEKAQAKEPASPKPAEKPAENPAAKPAEKPAEKPATPSPPSQTVTTGRREEHRVKMSRMRERIANRLKDSQNTYAMLTTFNEVDMSAIMNLRNDFKDVFLEKHGVKLGFMSAFVKASVIALKEQPAVNAVIDGSEIVYRDYVDISVAVSTPTGLVVPVLRNCDQLSFADIEKEINRLGKRARDGQLTLEDFAGGTFTISNGGVYGSMFGTPIINPPQSAILGMHAIVNRPVAVNDQVVIRPVMYVALTYDHRLIDGKDAVTFLKTIKHNIEDPRRMLLNV